MSQKSDKMTARDNRRMIFFFFFLRLYLPFELLQNLRRKWKNQIKDIEVSFSIKLLKLWYHDIKMLSCLSCREHNRLNLATV